jgi:enoyl-CoA hydratase/carnithine racemase
MEGRMGVDYEVRDQIAYLSFNRREKHNALRDEDIAALIDGLQRLDDDDTVRVGILFGQGRSFSSGGDVADRLERSVAEGSTSGRTSEAEAFTSCVHWKPMIAAVHGYCLGHALSTALQCDHIVASRDATFQVTETRIGLPMTSLIPRLGSPAFGLDVIMTGRMFTASEAFAGGIITRLVDEDHVGAAEALARQILENPDWAVRETVRVRRATLTEAAGRYRALEQPFDWSTSDAAKTAVAGLGQKVAHAERSEPKDR